MKKKFTSKVAAASLLIVVLFSSCVSSTLIQSNPSGAKVYIDGYQVGKTPYWYSDSKILGSQVDVDFVKDGYKPLYTSFWRDEMLDVGAIVGGLFCGVPFLWSLKYYPTHKYDLIPLRQPNEQVSTEVEVPQQVQKQEQLTNEATSTKIQKMRELKQMLDEKLILKEDFEKQKQKILDEK